MALGFNFCPTKTLLGFNKTTPKPHKGMLRGQIMEWKGGHNELERRLKNTKKHFLNHLRMRKILMEGKEGHNEFEGDLQRL